MWYRAVYAQVDPNIVQEWQAKIQAAQAIPDIHERSSALNSLLVEYYNQIGVVSEYDKSIRDPLKQITEQAFDESLALYQEQRAKEREVTGEPELEFDDAYTFPAWMEWREKTSGVLSDGDLAHLISAFEEDYAIHGQYIFAKPPRGSDYRVRSREVTNPEEIQFIKELRDLLQNKAFQLLEIDKTQLSDAQLWRIEGIGQYEKYLELVKQIVWMPPNDDPNAEGALLTFSISPSGIGIMAEIADPMPARLQKQELEKFMEDVEKFAPQEWSREIKYIEGGDFEAILSGKLDKDIKVYRMMSDDEYRQWQLGEVIPVGKYFSERRDLAKGTDFAEDGFREIFTFFVNRALMTGMDEHNMVNEVPLRLEGRRLLPV